MSEIDFDTMYISDHGNTFTCACFEKGVENGEYANSDEISHVILLSYIGQDKKKEICYVLVQTGFFGDLGSLKFLAYHPDQAPDNYPPIINDWNAVNFNGDCKYIDKNLLYRLMETLCDFVDGVDWRDAWIRTVDSINQENAGSVVEESLDSEILSSYGEW